MLGLICTCGGNLFRSEHNEDGYEEYICDSCDRLWYRCDLCNGDLHAYSENELELDVDHKNVATVKVRNTITVYET